MCVCGQSDKGARRYRLTLAATSAANNSTINSNTIALDPTFGHWHRDSDINSNSDHHCQHQQQRRRHQRYRCRGAKQAPSPSDTCKPLLCHPHTVTIRSLTQRQLRVHHQLDPSYGNRRRRRPKITVTLSHSIGRSRKISRRLCSINSRRKQRHKNRQRSNVRGPCVRHFPASRLVPRTKIAAAVHTALISIRQQQRRRQRQPIRVETQTQQRRPRLLQRRPHQQQVERPRRRTTSIDLRRSIRASEKIIALQLA